jgi:2-polyprenyl-3-methyl-5-hydroxy-6-metoxy-1,4-benzoquinol methylase
MTERRQVSFENPHEILDGFESLRRHHLAKQNARADQLARIPLPTDARILDVGCGPGLYLKTWLQITARQNASFVLADHSPSALATCEMVASAIGARHRVSTVAVDLHQLDVSHLGQFDVVFVGNTLQYLPDPIGWLRQVAMPLLRDGGLVAVRDLDCGILGCNLVDPLLVSRIVAARIAGCQRISRAGNFHDPFLGRDLKRIIESAGFGDVSLFPYHIEFKAPLGEAEKSYLSRLHTTWYVEDLAGLLTEADKERWSEAFDPDNPASALNDRHFYYTEAEFLAIGRRSASRP